MQTKENYSNFLFAASVFMLAVATFMMCFTVYFFFQAHHLKNNNQAHSTNGKKTIYPRDNCKEIDSAEAGRVFRENIKMNIDTPYGAWVGKDLLEQILTYPDIKNPFYTGIHILLGKVIDSKHDTITCFILRGGTEMKNSYCTDVQCAIDTSKYYILDAMCPASCDGLIPYISLKE